MPKNINFQTFFLDTQFLDDYLRRLEKDGQLRNHLVINRNLRGEIIYLMISSTLDFDEVRNENIISGTLIDVTEIISSQKKIKTQVAELKRIDVVKNVFMALSDNLTKHMSVDTLFTEFAVSARELFKLVNIRVLKVDMRSDNPQLTLVAADHSKNYVGANQKLGVVSNVDKDSIYVEAVQHKEPIYLSGKKKLNSAFHQFDLSTDFSDIEDYMLCPLECNGQIMYIVECFSRRSLGKVGWEETYSFVMQFNLLVSRALLNKEVRDNEKKWRSLAENSSEITCVVNEECDIQYMSKSTMRLFGIPAEEYLGKKMMEIIHPDDIPEASTCFTQTLAAGDDSTKHYHVLRFKTRLGGFLYMRVSALLSHNEAFEGCVVINAQNITELIEAENSKYLAVLTKEEEERKRISEDLHDGVGQHLAACVMYSNLLERSVHEHLDENAVNIYNKTKGLLEVAVAEVRQACHDIMPPFIEQEGFRKSIKKLIDDIDTSNPRLNVKYREEVELDEIPPDVALSLYRGCNSYLPMRLNMASLTG